MGDVHDIVRTSPNAGKEEKHDTHTHNASMGEANKANEIPLLADVKRECTSVLIFPAGAASSPLPPSSGRYL